MHTQDAYTYIYISMFIHMLENDFAQLISRWFARLKYRSRNAKVLV